MYIAITTIVYRKNVEKNILLGLISWRCWRIALTEIEINTIRYVNFQNFVQKKYLMLSTSILSTILRFSEIVLALISFVKKAV